MVCHAYITAVEYVAQQPFNNGCSTFLDITNLLFSVVPCIEKKNAKNLLQVEIASDGFGERL